MPQNGTDALDAKGMHEAEEEIVNEYKRRTPKSEEVWNNLRDGLLDGVASEGRYYEPYPLVIDKAEGSRIWDVDGNEYIDLYGDWGVATWGHSNPRIVEAVKQQVEKGSIYGFPHKLLFDFVNELKKRFPVDSFRLANSGTESTMHAIRTARGYTGKDKIVKMEGCYHGDHNDVLFSISPSIGKAGPEWDPTTYPACSGLPSNSRETTLVTSFNDPEALDDLLQEHSGDVAAVIMEPVGSFMGTVPPKQGYLQTVRNITEEHNVVFILDEVKTGCKIAYGGACEYYDVEPDMITLGKTIGGGLPLAAFGGKDEIMQEISFSGDGKHMGTYNGNPVTVAAGLAGLKELTNSEYQEMERLSNMLADGLKDAFEEKGIVAQVQNVAAIGAIYLGVTEEVTNYRISNKVNEKQGWNYWLSMLNRNVLFSIGTGAGGNWHISSATTEDEIETVLESNKEVIDRISEID